MNRRSFMARTLEAAAGVAGVLLTGRTEPQPAQSLAGSQRVAAASQPVVVPERLYWIGRDPATGKRALLLIEDGKPPQVVEQVDDLRFRMCTPAE